MKVLPAIALLAMTAAWGSTFYMINEVTAEMAVTDYLAVRFVIAAAFMAAVCARPLSVMSRTQWAVGLGLGGLYGVAQLVQTWGIDVTEQASVAGFVTGMYVVFTPLLVALWAWLRRRPTAVGWHLWAAVTVALLGIGLLAGAGVVAGLAGAGVGEAIILASAVLYALHIVVLGATAGTTSALGLAASQIIGVAIVCGAAALPGGVALPTTTSQWGVVLYTALIAGAAAMLAQTWAQKHVPAVTAAILMTGEPLFAALFAVWFGGEHLTTFIVVGGLCVVAAMLLAEVWPLWRTSRTNTSHV